MSDLLDATLACTQEIFNADFDSDASQELSQDSMQMEAQITFIVTRWLDLHAEHLFSLQLSKWLTKHEREYPSIQSYNKKKCL